MHVWQLKTFSVFLNFKHLDTENDIKMDSFEEKLLKEMIATSNSNNDVSNIFSDLEEDDGNIKNS